MIVYQVRSGVITVKSVLRETPSGWREHNNGFINRRVMGKYANLNECYYTTDVDEALHWSKILTSKLHEVLQVANASAVDLDYWVENGAREEDIPYPRWVL